MAVEAAISPLRQAELHAALLAVLERRGDSDPALLAHHAAGAGNAPAVLRHAAEAGRRSAALGARRAAAAQFERALEFAGGATEETRAALHEAAAEQYAMLDRWQQAEAALRIAIGLRRRARPRAAQRRQPAVLSMALNGGCARASPTRPPRRRSAGARDPAAQHQGCPGPTPASARSGSTGGQLGRLRRSCGSRSRRLGARAARTRAGQ
jgi:hypothetical protein